MRRSQRIGALVLAATVAAFAQSAGALTNVDGSAPLSGGERCPYDFLSDMPVGAFCVYRGVATETGGQPCGDEVVVIWSAHGGDGAAEAAPSRHVYFGFADAPSLLIHALAAQHLRARLVDYRASAGAPPQPLAGLSVLGRPTVGAGMLSLHLATPLVTGPCAFDSYRGLFIGVLDRTGRAPLDTAAE